MRRFIKSNVLIVSIAIIYTAAVLSSCGWSRTAKGGAIGAGAGAAIGGAIGSRSGNTATGAIIGAAVGGTAGALIGRYMDKQAEELQRDLKNARVERIGEGIKITFDSGILFDFDQYALRSEAKANIQDLARVLQKYEDTDILIEGHTDNTGSDEYNQGLSERRANSVASYTSALGVTRSRITTVGYGEQQPVADNTSPTGQQQNRRVEIAIMANKKLKRAAEKGDI